MIKEFIPYEQALELKELGFDELCITRYCTVTEWEKPTGEMFLQLQDCMLSDKNLTKAPLYQQAFRWFREKHNLFSFITTIDVYNQASDSYSFKFCFWLKDVENITMPVCETYEEAELACLKELIEMVKIKTI